MNIPNEAVEAAAKEIYRVAADLAYETDTWDDLSNGQRQVWVDDAKRILEAAAPHMLAGAWDEGCAEGFERGSDEYRLEGDQPNPYRPTP